MPNPRRADSALKTLIGIALAVCTAGAFAQQTPAPDYFIIVFPADRTRWYSGSRHIQATRPGTDGRFSIANVGPGDYHLAAVTDVDQFEWFDPAFLDQLVPAAVKVTLVEGETRTQDLRVSGG